MFSLWHSSIVFLFSKLFELPPFPAAPSVYYNRLSNHGKGPLTFYQVRRYDPASTNRNRFEQSCIPVASPHVSLLAVPRKYIYSIHIASEPLRFCAISHSIPHLTSDASPQVAACSPPVRLSLRVPVFFVLPVLSRNHPVKRPWVYSRSLAHSSELYTLRRALTAKSGSFTFHVIVFYVSAVATSTGKVWRHTSHIPAMGCPRFVNVLVRRNAVPTFFCCRVSR